jgi:hypothetical protein
MVIMLALALIIPFAYRIDVGPGPDSIRAMTWEYIEASWYTGFRLWDPFDTLLYTFLRLVFAVVIAGVFANRMTIRMALLTGILAELQPIAVSAPLVYLIDWSEDPQVPLYIPIPLMLFIGGCFLLLANRNRLEPDEPLNIATEKETEVGMKVVAIMQTVTEELNDSSRRAWGKMLGTLDEAHYLREQENENDKG